MSWWLKTCVGKSIFDIYWLVAFPISLNRINCLILDLYTSNQPRKRFSSVHKCQSEGKCKLSSRKILFWPQMVWLGSFWRQCGNLVIGARRWDWPIGAEQRLLLTKNSADFSHKQQTQEFHISSFSPNSKKNYAIMRVLACISFGCGADCDSCTGGGKLA